MFPAGIYRIIGSIAVPYDSLTIRGWSKRSRIVYEYEQTDGDTVSTASLFVFRDGIRDVTVRDLQLTYTGSFFPEFGSSYAGRVAGLRFEQCFDVLIANVEISGFNASGIMQSTGDPAKYAQRMKIHQCRLHRNRVAGVLYGNVEGISITDCDLDENGSEADGGTGYGCAGSSSEWPRRIQIIGNRAVRNYRKGIDLHAGTEAVIEGNVCHGNRLYGIYAVGNKTGNIVIRVNIISGMSRETTGLPEPYTWITGIDVGTHPVSTGADTSNYLIEGNLIADFGMGEGDAWPIHVYFKNDVGMLQIRNNTIRAGRITNLIRVRADGSGGREAKVDISGNQVFVQESTDYTMLLPDCTYLTIHGNQISTNQTSRNDGLIAAGGSSLKSLIYMGNHMNDPQYGSSHAIKDFDSDPIKQKIFQYGNFLNGVLEGN